MELDDALTQISEIRQQMARSQEFRGYRSATTAFSAAVAVAAAGAQWAWVPDPSDDFGRYLVIWLAAAVVSLAVVGVEMAVRSARSPSAMQRQVTLAAVDGFVPSLVAGALTTYAIAEHAPRSDELLPGLWMILFSLGIFASRRFLPRGAFAVACYYMLAGLWCLTLDGDAALAPWTMGAVFGVGQLAGAVLLFWFLERNDARE